jgi:hypothetical protein
MFLENHRDLSQKRKFPRVFMGSITGLSEQFEKSTLPLPLNGVLLALPNRTHVPVLDISVSGIVISPQGVLGQLRLGSVVDCKLKGLGLSESLPLKLRVLRLNAQSVCLMMESISSEYRLKLPQASRDQLVFQNLRPRSTLELNPLFQKGEWLHGPLDSNFLILKDEGGNLRQVIIEHDGVLLKYEPSLEGSEFQMLKSNSSTEEAKGYSGPWMDGIEQKVSLGADWKERVQKRIEILSETSIKHSEFYQTILRIVQRL